MSEKYQPRQPGNVDRSATLSVSAHGELLERQSVEKIYDLEPESEKIVDSLDVRDLPPGTYIEVQTQNTLYKLLVGEGGALQIKGHAKYCPDFTDTSIGTKSGGSSIRKGFITAGMLLGFVAADGGEKTTSAVDSIKVVYPNVN